MGTAVGEIRLEPLSASALQAEQGQLVDLLCSCVNSGGSLGFLAPLAKSDASEFWSGVVPQVESGSRLVLVARDGDRIVGSAQLAFESKQNGRHRAEVLKVMVDPAQRRRGIAAGLMAELERHARERSIRLLFLDTAEGESGARGFYESLGYAYVGGIPDYALDPRGRSTKNAIYFKALRISDSPH
ncbi:MAG TPA: GNAT family N-acetyltransferase [Thermoanaerobaculia bacterium]|nr:GNAT family N-acetyltransferase [Thermoanaerobaculia bacterium]